MSEPKAPPQLLLAGRWLVCNIGATAGVSDDQALIDKHPDGLPHRHRSQVVLSGQVRDRRHGRPWRQLPGADLLPQQLSQLQVQVLRRTMINPHAPQCDGMGTA